jgi:cardiolipin synthase A/B
MLWTIFTWAAPIQGAFLLTSIVALIAVASLARARRAPSATIAWVLAMVLLPPIGIPLFLIFGRRRLTQLQSQKQPLVLKANGSAPLTLPQPIGDGLLASLGIPSPSTGNSMKFHLDGETAFADLIQEIDQAKRRIHIETYEMKNDVAGKVIMERLTARAKEGLQVRLLLDALGAFYMSRIAIWRFWRAGGRFKWFLPIYPFLLARGNLRNHRKIYVFDDTRVLAGGRNLTANYLGPTPQASRWQDLSFVITGPAAAHYAEIFAADWGYATKEPIQLEPEPASPARGNAVVQVVPAGPDVDSDALYNITLTTVFEARKRLWLVTPYFVPNATLMEALKVAAERGVDVRVIVPDISDQLLPQLARGPYLRDITKVGGKALLHKGMVHAKVVVADDRLAMVGSANFDQRSMFLNFEVMSLLYSKPEIEAVAAYVDGLASNSLPDGAAVTVTRDTIESIAGLISPVL